MANPTLVVVAGCNGSGKSTYSKYLSKEHIVPFDYDAVFQKAYEGILENELRTHMAHEIAYADFTNQINIALEAKKDFCYETNFHHDPLHWPLIFKKKGYDIILYFFALNSITEAKRRVKIRTENGGHYVPANEIQIRFKLGYENLYKHFKFFDKVIVYDVTPYKTLPNAVLALISNETHLLNPIPPYLKARLKYLL